MVDVVRGSHVTTVDGDRFCGADDNVGGFGNVLVTGRQTQANIFLRYVVFGSFFFGNSIIDIRISQRYQNAGLISIFNDFSVRILVVIFAD